MIDYNNDDISEIITNYGVFLSKDKDDNIWGVKKFPIALRKTLSENQAIARLQLNGIDISVECGFAAHPDQELANIGVRLPVITKYKATLQKSGNCFEAESLDIIKTIALEVIPA